MKRQRKTKKASDEGHDEHTRERTNGRGLTVGTVKKVRALTGS